MDKRKADDTMDKRKADNTMDKRKRTKRQTIIHRD